MPDNKPKKAYSHSEQLSADDHPEIAYFATRHGLEHRPGPSADGRTRQRPGRWLVRRQPSCRRERGRQQKLEKRSWHLAKPD